MPSSLKKRDVPENMIQCFSLMSARSLDPEAAAPNHYTIIIIMHHG